jgi:hypothetical protein
MGGRSNIHSEKETNKPRTRKQRNEYDVKFWFHNTSKLETLMRVYNQNLSQGDCVTWVDCTDCRQSLIKDFYFEEDRLSGSRNFINYRPTRNTQ